MEFSSSIKVLQIVSGAVGFVVGTGMTFFPIAFQASVGILLGDNISQLSETRAPGASLLIGSIIVLLSVFKPGLRRTGLVLTALMYFGYGAGRTISLVLDGIPHQSLLLALTIELAVGGLALLGLWRTRKEAISSSMTVV